VKPAIVKINIEAGLAQYPVPNRNTNTTIGIAAIRNQVSAIATFIFWGIA
jgi:hypothetical protein